MKRLLLNLRLPITISFILTSPLAIMELINQPDSIHNFPYALFIVLWILPLLFTLTLIPIVRNAKAGTNLMAKPLSFLFSITIMVIITLMWFGILSDQMPCFLGVPNCD